MKKLFFALFLFVFAQSLYAQLTINNFGDKAVCWLGIDFTLAKLIGATGFSDPDKIKSHYFGEWNYLIIRESDSYDIKGAFDLNEVTYQLDPVIAANQEINMDGYIQENSHSISQEQIQGALVKYDLSAVKEEVGISFFVANFNKNIEEAVIWVVLSEIGTKNIFFARELKGKPSGIGFRNYWAGAIRATISSCNKEIKKWKKGK